MADIIDYRLFGEEVQLVEIELDPGETVRADARAVRYLEEGVEMQPVRPASGPHEILRDDARLPSGLCDLVCRGGTRARIGLGGATPGRVVAVRLGHLDGAFLCRTTAFLCAAGGTEVQVASIPTTDETLTLLRLRGEGMAFLHAGGSLLQRKLGAGERLTVEAGSVVGMTDGVGHAAGAAGCSPMEGRSGEPPSFVVLAGPGIVYLQSLPFPRSRGGP